MWLQTAFNRTPLLSLSPLKTQKALSVIFCFFCSEELLWKQAVQDAEGTIVAIQVDNCYCQSTTSKKYGLISALSFWCGETTPQRHTYIFKIRKLISIVIHFFSHFTFCTFTLFFQPKGSVIVFMTGKIHAYALRRTFSVHVHLWVQRKQMSYFMKFKELSSSSVYLKSSKNEYLEKADVHPVAAHWNAASIKDNDEAVNAERKV